MNKDALDEGVLSSVKAELIEKAVAELLDSAWEMYDERRKVARRALLLGLLAGLVALAVWLLFDGEVWVLPTAVGILLGLQGFQQHADLGGRLAAIAGLATSLRNDGLELNSAGSERSIRFSYMAREEFRRVQRIAKHLSEV